MNTRTYQSAVTRLAINPDYRDRVKTKDQQALADRLSELERQRLSCIAKDQGLEITRTLHKSFRLNKILGRTPLCRVLLGTDRMAQELERFWQHRLPTSFYYLQEAIAFCDYLLCRTESGLEVNFLREIVAFERAELRLQLSNRDDSESIQAVRFECAASDLLKALSSGTIPQCLPDEPHMLIGSREHEGVIQWHNISLELWDAWLNRTEKTGLFSAAR